MNLEKGKQNCKSKVKDKGDTERHQNRHKFKYEGKDRSLHLTEGSNGKLCGSLEG